MALSPPVLIMMKHNIETRFVGIVCAALVCASCAKQPKPQRTLSVPAIASSLMEDTENVDGYFTVGQQRAIAQAAKRFWTDANPREDWRSIVLKVVGACGAMRMDEAFIIVRHHPRTEYDWAWRGPVEAALFENRTWTWSPRAPRVQCTLIKQAAGIGDSNVQASEKSR